jgi:hypothetical protein
MAIQDRYGGSGLGADPAQSPDGEASEDHSLPIRVGVFDRSDERRDGRPRRRADLAEDGRRTYAHVLVRALQDLQKGRHRRATDPDQRFFHRVIDEERAHASAMLTPSLEESLDEDRNCHLRTRTNQD